MNVYDCANSLSLAIKDSQEYKRLKQAKEAIRQDPDAKKMAEDFLGKQARLQLEAMSGKEIPAPKQEQLQRLYELIARNDKGRDYLQSYMRFQLMMEDIQKTMADVIKPVVNLDSDE